MTAEDYYKLKVRPIYRSYPMYVRGREPAGYIESLKQKEPEIIFDRAKLHTSEDWVAVGKLVFESRTSFGPAPAHAPSEAPFGLPISTDGVLPEYVPGLRYYVRTKGVLEVGSNSCASCHTREMPDGSHFEGAQTSFGGPGPAATLRRFLDSSPTAFPQILDRAWASFGAHGS